MSQPQKRGEQSPKPEAFSISIDHPDQGTHVPPVFTVQGTYSLSFGSGTQVQCVVKYASGSKSQCRWCFLDSTGTDWCCQFDLSADLPVVGDTLVLAATLWVNGAQVAGPDSKSLVFDPAAMDQYTCPQPGTPC